MNVPHLAAQESNKTPGICYAMTVDKVELPVVDVTHPVFSLTMSESEQRALIDNFLRQGVPFGFLPKPMRTALLGLVLRGSVLAQGVRQAQGSFMSGMHTYLLKLGPQMLPSAITHPIDRRIAAALPALGVRLRLQDVAHLMADILSPALLADPRRPLHFINIAGGPAIDSLNALILLNQHPGTLQTRELAIDVLDQDDAGPAFGEAALSALSKAGGPLAGVRVDFRHVRYD